MKITLKIFLVLCILLQVFACQKSIPLNLPKYEPKMVLEFFLQDDQALTCLLQESINYTDTTKLKLIDNALVVLSYNGVSDTLYNRPFIDQKLGKFYNYSNPKKIKLDPNITYNVYVKDTQGREMRGQTSMKEIVPLESLIYQLNEKNEAKAILTFNDEFKANNFYILVTFRNTPFLGKGKLRDIRINDILFNGKQFSYETGFNFERGDTITGRLYHLTEAHYNFTESVSNAQGANGNPLAQPANIVSNVTGGIGIFSTLSYDEKVRIIE